MRSEPIAFFDADGTLTTTNGIFGFLRFYLRAQGRPAEFERRRGRLRAMTERGCARETTNRAYYRSYTGADESEVAALAREWTQGRLLDGRWLRRSAVERLRAHQDAGERCVIVTGSFPALIRPLADHLGIDEVHCTVPEIRDGRYTGNLAEPPMIGEAKALAVRGIAEAWNAEPNRCHAYGDHASDLPMMRAVGRPVAVGADPFLTAEARARNWTRIAS